MKRCLEFCNVEYAWDSFVTRANCSVMHQDLFMTSVTVHIRVGISEAKEECACDFPNCLHQGEHKRGLFIMHQYLFLTCVTFHTRVGISEAKEARKHRQRTRGVDVEDLVRVDDGEDREKEPEGPDVCVRAWCQCILLIFTVFILSHSLHLTVYFRHGFSYYTLISR